MQLALDHGFINHLLRALPDFLRVMFHPSRLGVNLDVLLLRVGHNSAGTIKYDEPRAGGALVDGGDVLGLLHVFNMREKRRIMIDPGILTTRISWLLPWLSTVNGSIAVHS